MGFVVAYSLAAMLHTAGFTVTTACFLPSLLVTRLVHLVVLLPRMVA